MGLVSSKLMIRKEAFQSNQKRITEANARSLLLLCAIGGSIGLVLSILSIPAIGVLRLLPSYLALTAVFICIAVSSRLVVRKQPALLPLLIYILLFFLDSIAIVMGTVQSHNSNATTFLLFLLLPPLFLMDYPWRLSLANAIMTVIFLITASVVQKPEAILSVDIANVCIVYLVSLVFIEVMMQRTLQNMELTKKEEEELQRKNRLINQLPVGIAVFEVKGDQVKQSFSNDEFYRLFQDTREARTARSQGNFMSGIHPDDRAKLSNVIQSVCQGQNYATMACRALKGDGSYLWVRFSASVAQRQGDYLQVYSTYSSMEAEMKSRQATQAKTDFLSRISHDMRTPLNGILGLTTLLLDKTEDEEVLQDLQQLKLSGQYLLNLINDTLDVSRIESGKMTLNPVVCDGRNAFQNIISLIQPNLQEKDLHFEAQVEEFEFHILYMDVGRLEQIVMNVLGNAIKFTPRGGSIVCGMKELSNENGMQMVHLTVQDSGVGISKEFLPHIFDAFSQEDATRTSSYQGTGLGLSISRQLLQLMGGEIVITSEPGQGTCVTLMIPMKLATSEQVKAWEENRKLEYHDEQVLEGKKVLLCEDHPLNAMIATKLLTAKKIKVEHAENGQIGVERFQQSEVGYYDAILMDIRMPVMDGLEATKRIRRLERADAKTIPILAMTANAFDEDVRQTKEAGMNAHLSKPIQVETIFTTLESFWGKARERQKG